MQVQHIMTFLITYSTYVVVRPKRDSWWQCDGNIAINTCIFLEIVLSQIFLFNYTERVLPGTKATGACC